MAGPSLMYTGGHHVKFKNERQADSSESASSNSTAHIYTCNPPEYDTDATGVGLTRRKKSKTSASRNNSIQDPRFLFDQDFSDFHQQFRQSFSMAPPPNSLPGVGTTNGATMTAESPTHLSVPENRMSVSFSDQGPSSVIPAKRPSADITEPSKRRKSAVEDSTLPSSKRPSVDGKTKSPRPKGTGIYKTGTWDYAPDDDQDTERITKDVKEISATIEASGQKLAKITRNSYNKMKSTLRSNSTTTTPSQEPPVVNERKESNAANPSLQPDTNLRRSSRAHNAPDYSSFSAIEIDDDAADTEETAMMRPAKQRSPPSTLHSHASQDSTSTRSTSASTAPQQLEIEQAVRPKKTWTAIVYEVIANAKKRSLTLIEIGEAIKARYPYFRSPVHADTLKSSPRNPLYAHQAFCKVQRGDGKLAWGLNPGNFYDKKTGKLLTAGSPVADAITPVASSGTAVRKNVRVPNQPAPAATAETRYNHRPTRELEIKKELRPVTLESLNPKTPYILPANPPQKNFEGTETELEAVQRTEAAGPSPSIVQSQNNSPKPMSKVHSETIVVQPSGPSPLQSREQRRLAGIVHKDLSDSFTDLEMETFLQETKLWYFKHMDLEKQDLNQILEAIVADKLKSTDEEISACADDLRKDFEERTWESEWFLNFVKREVTTFNIHMSGYMTYTSRAKLIRLDHWAGPKFWSRDTFKKIFAPFADTVDLEKIWHTRLWHDFVKKVFCIACDSTWEYRFAEEGGKGGGGGGGEGVYGSIRAVLNERYPDRSGDFWIVPRVHPGMVEVRRRAVAVAGGGEVEDAPAGSQNGGLTAPEMQNSNVGLEDVIV